MLFDRRDNDTISRLRNPKPYHTIRARTNKFQKSFLLLFEQLHIAKWLSLTLSKYTTTFSLFDWLTDLVMQHWTQLLIAIQLTVLMCEHCFTVCFNYSRICFNVCCNPAFLAAKSNKVILFTASIPISRLINSAKRQIIKNLSNYNLGPVAPTSLNFKSYFSPDLRTTYGRLYGS